MKKMTNKTSPILETEHVLSVKNVSYEIENTKLIHDITLDIPKGSFVGIIGPNGSGKSTLLKTIYRAHQASAGCIYLNGHEMNHMTNKEIARQMAVVSQENAINFDFLRFSTVISKSSSVSPTNPAIISEPKKGLSKRETISSI